MPVIVEQPLLSTVQESSVRSRSRDRANKRSKTIFHLAAIRAIRMAGDLKTY